MSDKELERRLSFSHHGGRGSGLKDAADYVMERASVLFEMGKDERARDFRELSVHLKSMADAARATQREYGEL
jgi:hypothetical protein